MLAGITAAETGGAETACLDILPPGSDGEVIFAGSMEVDNPETEPLPKDGEWAIRVHLMGTDVDAGKTVAHNLELSIRSPTRG